MSKEIGRHPQSARIDPSRQKIFDQGAEVGLTSKLSPRDRAILEMRFGSASTGGKPRTQAEIAREFRVVPERVRQLEKRALLKLKNMLDKQSS